MIVQGFMMNLSYDQTTTISSLASMGQIDIVFDFILNNITNMENDFEIKRLIIGLTTLTMKNESAQIDQSIQNRFKNFMEAILYLC
jgi:hypothetical protein